VEIRLLPVDGFTPQDLPFPRGELLVRATNGVHPRQIPGYWNSRTSRDRTSGDRASDDNVGYHLHDRFVADPLTAIGERQAPCDDAKGDPGSNAITAKGLFFRTGDIVELRPHLKGDQFQAAANELSVGDGVGVRSRADQNCVAVTERSHPFVRIIGRSGTCFKMSNGVFVSPDHLEGLLTQHAEGLVAQLYVHHDSSSRCVMQVILSFNGLLVRLFHMWTLCNFFCSKFYFFCPDGHETG